MSEWQPIATAPKNGARILLGRQHTNYFCSAKVDVGYWQPKTMWWMPHWRGTKYLHGLNGDLSNSPTHWMPLPEPPK